ncbi:peptidase S8/S53 domain-containing protein [Coprinopsis sp. MPI-PUGE-AT-0042]|nr:peptidase S8/S53 domain-containing protein [Coprinopsis sp. MPI-PUGE-AT-0042]
MIFGNTIYLALCFVGQALVVNAEAGSASKGYIVTLKDSVSKGAALSKLQAARRASRVVDTKIQEWDHAIHGFATQLTDSEVTALRQSSGVVDIEEDGIVHAYATQTNAPWGIARLSSKTPLPSQNTAALNYTFIYDNPAGGGVDIYVLDTGVRATHQEFDTRVITAPPFVGSSPVDGNGHGTHIAGTAAGSRVGVAKAATIISVKVLSDSGSGTVSGIISGINWVSSTAQSSKRPAVVLLALGGGVSTALDNAVAALTSSGIHVVVAAGGSNTGAENSSPGRVPSVILVGATTIADARASFSNYGPLIDVFAPGVSIYSSWSTSDTAYNTLSGSSMAAAHVAGVVAYLIGREGNVSPVAMEAKIRQRALNGALSGIPSGTANLLAQI